MYMTVRAGATDPVCGMTVDRAKALRENHGGQTFYFCSEHCRSGFRLPLSSHHVDDAELFARMHASLRRLGPARRGGLA